MPWPLEKRRVGTVTAPTTCVPWAWLCCRGSKMLLLWGRLTMLQFCLLRGWPNLILLSSASPLDQYLIQAIVERIPNSLSISFSKTLSDFTPDLTSTKLKGTFRSHMHLFYSSFYAAWNINALHLHSKDLTQHKLSCKIPLYRNNFNFSLKMNSMSAEPEAFQLMWRAWKKIKGIWKKKQGITWKRCLEHWKRYPSAEITSTFLSRWPAWRLNLGHFSWSGAPGKK